MSSNTSFTLSANPGTDIWRKPPGTDIWNAPISATHTQTGPLKSFRSARITFSARWSERYDQAGLLLVPRPSTSTSVPPAKWVKTGIEFYQGTPQFSTVGCDRYADWSISPGSGRGGEGEEVTVEVVREGDEHGRSIWIYHVGEEGKRTPLREITWFLADEDGEEDWVLDVSPLVARPEKNAEGELVVEFRDFEVVWG
ncbi:hypothetical protein GGS20DRAFT_587871 [Poronia punctata]|nr:hypothetical protein GGS20DRAFT_587871 [Poronia punctata]